MEPAAIWESFVLGNMLILTKTNHKKKTSIKQENSLYTHTDHNSCFVEMKICITHFIHTLQKANFNSTIILLTIYGKTKKVIF